MLVADAFALSGTLAIKYTGSVRLKIHAHLAIAISLFGALSHKKDDNYTTKY